MARASRGLLLRFLRHRRWFVIAARALPENLLANAIAELLHHQQWQSLLVIRWSVAGYCLARGGSQVPQPRSAKVLLVARYPGVPYRYSESAYACRYALSTVEVL